jgi:hypothetical protein
MKKLILKIRLEYFEIPIYSFYFLIRVHSRFFS